MEKVGYQAHSLRHLPLYIACISVPAGISPLFPRLSRATTRRRGRTPSLIACFAPRVSAARALRSVCLRPKNRELSGNFGFLRPVQRFSTGNHRAFSVSYGQVPCSKGTGNLIRRIREKIPPNREITRKNSEAANSGSATPIEVLSTSRMALVPCRRHAIPKSRACSAQSIGMPSRISCATEMSGGWRPSRIATCTLGARKASGIRVRM